MNCVLQRQVRAVAGRRPVPGPHAALHHVRQRAADHARGLHRQDHGVLDLHLSRRRRAASALPPTHQPKQALDYLMKICYENLTLLQISLFDFRYRWVWRFCTLWLGSVGREAETRTIQSSPRITSQTYWTPTNVFTLPTQRRSDGVRRRQRGRATSAEQVH